MSRVPVYRQKLVLVRWTHDISHTQKLEIILMLLLSQVKKEMLSIQKRLQKLSQKSEQLRSTRDKIREGERQQAARMAKLEARVVTTTPTPGGGSGSGAAGTSSTKVIQVSD